MKELELLKKEIRTRIDFNNERNKNKSTPKEVDAAILIANSNLYNALIIIEIEILKNKNK